jgi:tetratricopeptide (TPR) repeat protein
MEKSAAVPEVNFFLAMELMEPHRLDKLVAELDVKTRQFPNDVRRIMLLGTAHYLRGRQASAIAAFRRAIAIKADLPYAHYYLGVALYLNAQTEAAITSLKTAIDLYPYWSMAHYWLGVAYYHQGAYAEAQQCFETVLRDSPEMHDAGYHAALACVATSDYARARDHLERLSKKTDAADPHVQLLLGRSYFGLNKMADAMAAYRAGLAKHPEDPALAAALAELEDVPAP